MCVLKCPRNAEVFINPLLSSLPVGHQATSQLKLTKIQKNPLITTQEFLLLIYGGYYNMFWSTGTIFTLYISKIAKKIHWVYGWFM